jgi:hypothetical protein
LSLACFSFPLFVVVLLACLILSPKACLQTILGIVIYRNDVSFMAVVGIVLVIGGSAAYTYVRKMENDAKEAAATGGKQ